MFNRFGFAVVLALLVFFSGCIDQKDSIEKRMLCLELSSQGFATVPDCTTQQSCFEGVNSAFFGFDESALSYSERQQLLDYKNKLALSWLYYNTALKNIKNVHDICYSDSGFADLPQQVNELNFNLSMAFKNIDAANKSAFGLMLLQQSELQRQEVSLIKEETVFDDLVLLSNNLNALREQPENTDQKLFVGKYFSLVSEFDALSKANGFETVVLNKSSVFDLLGQNSGLIVKEFVGNSFFVPLISEAVSGTINSITSSFRLSGSVSALKKFPAFEFSVLFGKFVGTQGSLSSEFGKMQAEIALHRSGLREKNFLLEREISGLFSSSEKRIGEIDSDSFADFDQNLLAELYLLLGQEQSAIVQQRFSLSQISSFKQDALQELSGLETDFSALKQKDFFNELPLGKKTGGFKQILVSIEELNENIDFFCEETITSLETVCTERLSEIEKKIASTKLENAPLQLFDLKAKTEYYIGQFGDAKETEKRLFYCRRAIETDNSFRQANENFEDYSVNLAASAKNCLVFLEKIFKTESQELQDFLPSYRQLSVLEENNAGVENIAKACFGLEESIVFRLSNNKKVIESQDNFSKANKLISALSALKQHYPEQLSGIQVDFLRGKLERLKEFFDSDSKLALDRALPALDEIGKNSSLLLQEAIEETQNALVDYFKKFAQIKEFSGSHIKVSFENPLGFPFDYPIGFSIPFGYKKAELASSSENVVSARADSNRLFIDLKSVPLGNIFLDFYSSFSSDTQQESFNSFLLEKDLLEKLLAEKEKEFFVLQDFNLSGNAAELSLAIASARQAVEEAVLLADNGNFDSAAKKLSSAKKFLESGSNGINELLVEERDFLLKIPFLSGKNSNDQNLALLKGEIFSLDSLFLKAISSNDSNSALFLLKQMKLKAQDFNAAANSGVSEAVSGTKAKIDSFRQLLSKNGIAEKLGRLNSLFQSASDNDLEIANYILPFSRSFPEKNLLKLSELDSARLQKKFSEFDSFLEKKDYFSAFNAIPSFEQELEANLKELGLMDESVSKALARIEEDAIVSVNAAKDFAAQSGNKELAKQAGLAEKELEKKNFLKAIILAKPVENSAPLAQASGLAGLALPSIPIAIIPLLGVIAVALFVKRQREKKETQKLRLQKLFRNR